MWRGDAAVRNNDAYNNLTNYIGIDDPAASANISVDPCFLADGVHIPVDSQCAGKGDNRYVETDDTDIDGQPRILPVNGKVDIGADESENCGVHLVLLPPESPLPIGNITVTAIVTRDDGTPAVGVVYFSVDDGPAVSATIGPDGRAQATLPCNGVGRHTVKAWTLDACSDTLTMSTSVYTYDPARPAVEIFFCMDCTSSMWEETGDHGAQASVQKLLEDLAQLPINLRLGGIKFNNTSLVSPYEWGPDHIDMDQLYPLAPFYGDPEPFISGWVNNGYEGIGGDIPELQLDALHYAAVEMSAHAISTRKYIVLITDHEFHSTADGYTYSKSGVEADLMATGCPVYISLWENPNDAYLDSYYADLCVNSGFLDPCSYFATDVTRFYPLARLRTAISECIPN